MRSFRIFLLKLGNTEKVPGGAGKRTHIISNVLFFLNTKCSYMKQCTMYHTEFQSSSSVSVAICMMNILTVTF